VARTITGACTRRQPRKSDMGQTATWRHICATSAPPSKQTFANTIGTSVEGHEQKSRRIIKFVTNPGFEECYCLR
jgi:hypothetical protein